MRHPTALIHPNAQLADDVEVGAYSIIGEHVEIGAGTSVGPHVVIAGHISSDTLGLNLLLDNIEKYAKQDFEVIACSGFTRIKRKTS